jgi:hypothetical protein
MFLAVIGSMVSDPSASVQPAVRSNEIRVTAVPTSAPIATARPTARPTSAPAYTDPYGDEAYWLAMADIMDGISTESLAIGEADSLSDMLAQAEASLPILRGYLADLRNIDPPPAARHAHDILTQSLELEVQSIEAMLGGDMELALDLIERSNVLLDDALVELEALLEEVQ